MRSKHRCIWDWPFDGSKIQKLGSSVTLTPNRLAGGNTESSFCNAKLMMPVKLTALVVVLELTVGPSNQEMRFLWSSVPIKKFMSASSILEVS